MEPRRENQEKHVYATVKRVLDVFFSFLLLFFLALPMLLIWFSVRISSRGEGIFKQARIGKNGKSFVCYKFRTMYKDAPSNTPSSDFASVEKYVTPIGRILRRTSLDELPQLFNVLKGDMSLVGPRPLIFEETEMHRMRKEAGIYSIRPGLTGLSQINGRDSITDERKAELDRAYLEAFGFIQDVKIIGKTVTGVISGDGIAKGKQK
ncbi:MAG: sugar transferase [Ruminococcaceae bacterium]|nr:sugar transferase [Oscillospiraceae bacterium]